MTKNCEELTESFTLELDSQGNAMHGSHHSKYYNQLEIPNAISPIPQMSISQPPNNLKKANINRKLCSKIKTFEDKAHDGLDSIAISRNGKIK